MENHRDCVIVGGGPAGMMAGVLLARAGLRVTVVEKHPDFHHDFRGDTIHPSTLQVMSDLGWLPEFLTLPHQKAEQLHAQMAGQQVKIADFSRLPVACRYIAFMPQWDFLRFLAAKGAAMPGFELRMGTGVEAVLHDGPVVSGVRLTSGEDLRGGLVIAADGRHSVLRKAAGLRPHDFGSPVDVVWLKLSRQPADAVPAMSHAGPQQGLVLIDRGDYWQCGYVIRKGSFADVQAAGLPAFRAALAALAPLPAARFDEVEDWSQVHLLSIRMDRLERWWVPGLLCIGDAAHAMSPVGGFGVNLAVQDAVATARILTEPLRQGRVSPADLARVEARRMPPTRMTQALQRMMRRKRDANGNAAPRPPGFVRAIIRLPWLSHVMGRLIGVGFRSERIGARE